MNNNTVKRKRNEKKEDFSFVDEVPKEQTKGEVDISTDMIDIRNTPDVATWNKGMQVKGESADIVNTAASHEAKRATTINMGLKEKGSKDLIRDPNEKDVEESHDQS
jgi:hypothetical protein